MLIGVPANDKAKQMAVSSNLIEPTLTAEDDSRAQVLDSLDLRTRSPNCRGMVRLQFLVLRY